jgi:hypothetical protein
MLRLENDWRRNGFVLEWITIDGIQASFIEALVKDSPRRYVLNRELSGIKMKTTIVIFATFKK